MQGLFLQTPPRLFTGLTFGTPTKTLQAHLSAVANSTVAFHRADLDALGECC